MRDWLNRRWTDTSERSVELRLEPSVSDTRVMSVLAALKRAGATRLTLAYVPPSTDAGDAGSDGAETDRADR
ncbi:MAG: hypothetical protein ABEL76_14445 [Bradymonadaceae bacterium]